MNKVYEVLDKRIDTIEGWVEDLDVKITLCKEESFLCELNNLKNQRALLLETIAIIKDTKQIINLQLMLDEGVFTNETN